MPCRYDDDGRYCNCCVDKDKELARLRKNLDTITRYLCGSLKTLEDEGYLIDNMFGDEVVKWWVEHQKQDAKRQAEEKKKLDAEKAADMEVIQKLKDKWKLK